MTDIRCCGCTIAFSIVPECEVRKMDRLKRIKLFLLDMDGTIYLDNSLFDGTTDFLNYVKSIDGRYIFLTNNSSKSVDKYIEKLNGMGIAADKMKIMGLYDEMRT